MATFYFVEHPMKEPRYGRAANGERIPVRWAIRQPHHRKFMMRQGEYLDGSNLKYEKFYFWGEYEAHSDCIIKNITNTPIAIHDVLHPVRGTAPLLTNALNTDPYVFGNHFKNICCGIRNGKYEHGDVVLFGYKEGNCFYFDTVFVVDRKRYIDYLHQTTQYYKASIEPLNRDRKNAEPSLPRVEYYFQGISYYENREYYSFVPCTLDYTTQQLPSVPQDFRKKVVTKERWDKILLAVYEAGWLQGVHVDKI